MTMYGELPDREAANMLLAFKYTLGTEFKSVLAEACANGDLELVKLLLASDSVNLREKNDSSLRTACHKGYVELVELLLDFGANLHVMDDFALSIACGRGHLDVVTLLLDRGANADALNCRAIYKACAEGQKEVVELLFLRYGTKRLDIEGAVLEAIKADRVAVVELILDSAPELRRFGELLFTGPAMDMSKDMLAMLRSKEYAAQLGF